MQPIIIIGGYLLISLYTMLQLNHWLSLISKGILLRFIWDLLFIGATALPIVGIYFTRQPFSRLCLQYGNIWVGFLIFFTLAMVFFNIVRFIIWLSTHHNKNANKSKTAPWLGLFVIFTCILISMTINIYGMVKAHRITTTKYPITLSKKTKAKGNLKVVLISDLKLGANTYKKQMRALVREVNKHNADIIVIAGDIFDGNFEALKNPNEYSNLLKNMKSKQGIYAVYGNNDLETKTLAGIELSPKESNIRGSNMDKFISSAGIQVMEDTGIFVNGIQIIGRLDGINTGKGKSNRAKITSLTAQLDTKMPIMVIQHEPNDFKNLAASGVDIALSGHTRGGQFFPVTIASSFMNENNYGLAPVHGVYSIVTSGVGSSGPPIRIGTNSEIAVVDINY